jgi:putative ABC transport system permease protein
MNEFWNDLRYGVRSLRRAPAFPAAAIAILGTSVALAAVTFSLVRGYLLRPLPYPDATRVVQFLADASRTFANTPRGLETIDVAALREVFVETAAWDLDGFTVVGGEHPEFVDGAWVNPGFFTIVGARPLLGRLLSADDVKSGARVVVISHAYWQRHFGGRADVVNQPLRAFSTDRPLSGDLFTVVGVLPPDFWHVNTFTDILAPLTTPRLPSLARLAPGVSVEGATERLNRAARAAIPSASPSWRMGLVPVQEEYSRQIRPTLLVLFAAVACVLLVACANVAGLLMVRGVWRRREFSVRAALGASRSRLFRQQLAESLLLAAAAAAASAWLTFISVDVVAAWMETQLGVDVPGGIGTVRLDWPLALFTGITAMAAGVLTGFRPAIGAARTGGGELLASITRADTAGRGQARFRAVMVVSQVALSFLLLTGAGLMVQTLAALQHTRLGFTPDSVLKAHVLLPQARYANQASRVSATRDMIDRVSSLAGVEAVSVVMPPPFRFQGNQPMFAEGVDPGHLQAAHHVVAGDYWRTMRIRLIEGRVFDDRDHATSAPVALISASLATRIWPDRSAVGRRIRRSAAADAPWLTVVGIVDDVRKTFTEQVVGDTYVPYAQAPGGYIALMVRGAGDPTALTQTVQGRLSTVAPDLPMHDIETMSSVVARQSRQPRFLAVLLGAFGAITVVIALVGLYSVLTFTVATRRREIAVRVAIGASRRQIWQGIAREGVVLIAGGLLAGVGVSLVLARGIASQLFGVTPFDPAAYAGAAILFGSVSMLAIYAPAMRAARLDAAEALKND